MKTSSRPQGRDEIRQAVIEAARGLIAERGPDGFSVRDIAARADVNHALVHRHFGTKAEVLQQVLATEADLVAAAVGDWRSSGSGTPEELLKLLSAYPSFWRALVHAVLEAPDVAVPGTAVTTELFASLWRGLDPSHAASTTVAASTVLGWIIFGSFMTETTGADADEVRRIAADQVIRLTAR
ncbi:MAG TPA: TetR/AcrR family transcriptional regulator [Nocardioidaceae bacterium]|nr:TetR/AcrR family transcriptional regulator [Nocardioidaceae bacterium]